MGRARTGGGGAAGDPAAGVTAPAAGEVACRDERGRTRRSELRAYVGGRNICGRAEWAGGGHGCKEKKPRMDFNSSMEDLRYKH